VETVKDLFVYLFIYLLTNSQRWQVKTWRCHWQRKGKKI